MVKDLALTVHGFVKVHKVYKLDSIIIKNNMLVGEKNHYVSTKGTQSQIKVFHQKKINALTTWFCAENKFYKLDSIMIKKK